MFKYFKELLSTLKKIEKHLEVISKNSEKVAGCVGKKLHSNSPAIAVNTQQY